MPSKHTYTEVRTALDSVKKMVFSTTPLEVGGTRGLPVKTKVPLKSLLKANRSSLLNSSLRLVYTTMLTAELRMKQKSRTLTVMRSQIGGCFTPWGDTHMIWTCEIERSNSTRKGMKICCA